MSRLTLRSLRSACFLAVLLLATVGLSVGAATSSDSAERIVVVGDVHGDFNDFCAILQKAGLIDEQRHWVGGEATLVQLGDLLDRGPKVREALDLMMSLEEQALKAGGRVVALMGNHEEMNLIGDLRYVTAENYASFADSDSEKRQKTAYQEYAAWRKNHAQLLAEVFNPVLPETEAEWMTKHPPGFVEHREAFGPKGNYGKWLRQRSAVARIKGVIFLHGGISSNVASLTLEDINSRIRDEIQQYDQIRQYLTDANVLLPLFTVQEEAAVVQAEVIAERKGHVPANEMRQAKIMQLLGFGSWLCVREDGPLWFRGYDQWSEEEGLAQVEKILGAYNATNLVVGHTVQKTSYIRSRFGGKVFLIDTGMLSSYYPGGRASALEITGEDEIAALYMDKRVVLLEGKSGHK